MHKKSNFNLNFSCETCVQHCVYLYNRFKIHNEDIFLFQKLFLYFLFSR